MANKSQTTDTAAGVEAAEVTTAAQYTVEPYTSDSNVYTVITGTLGGDRAVYSDAAAVLAALVSIAAKVNGEISVLIASTRAVMLAEVTIDDISEIEPGAEGYVVSTLGVRGVECADGKKRNGITGLAVYPAHTVESVLAHSAGRDYLSRLLAKEMGLVAFRKVRNIVGDTLDVLSQYAAAMPVTLDDFVVRQTQSGGAAVNAFTSNWGSFRKLLAANPAMKELLGVLPNMKELAKCIQSRDYAMTSTPQNAVLEEDGTFVQIASIMANVIRADQADAAETGDEPEYKGDAALLDNWLANRDTVTFESAPQVVKRVKADFSAFGAIGVKVS